MTSGVDRAFAEWDGPCVPYLSQHQHENCCSSPKKEKLKILLFSKEEETNWKCCSSPKKKIKQLKILFIPKYINRQKILLIRKEEEKKNSLTYCSSPKKKKKIPKMLLITSVEKKILLIPKEEMKLVNFANPERGKIHAGLRQTAPSFPLLRCCNDNVNVSLAWNTLLLSFFFFQLFKGSVHLASVW